MPSSELATADRLYQGFPDFAAWGLLDRKDLDLWRRYAVSLRERRKGATPEALRKAVDVAVRAAALDTGAIEGLYTVDRGFTMTVAVQGLAWEQMIEERGAGVRELFEAQLEAYELVLDAATHRMPITEAWIRALHEKLCAPQQNYRVLTAAGWQEHELPKGRYKTQPNHVKLADGSVHAYAPVDQVASEMHRLVEQIGSSSFKSADPVRQASYVHYALVAIHPFADGNGRVARALASVYFYRACSIPLLVFANQRLAYFDALHAADLGDHRPLIAFFRDRGIDTMQLVTESLLATREPSLEALADRLRTRRAPSATLSPEESENLRLRISGKIASRFDAGLMALGLAPHVSSTSSITPERHVLVRLLDRLTGSVASLDAYVRIHPESPFPVQIHTSQHADDLSLRLEDVFPEPSESFELRLSQWVERHLRRLLTEIAGPPQPPA